MAAAAGQFEKLQTVNSVTIRRPVQFKEETRALVSENVSVQPKKTLLLSYLLFKNVL